MTKCKYLTHAQKRFLIVKWPIYLYIYISSSYCNSLTKFLIWVDSLFPFKSTDRTLIFGTHDAFDKLFILKPCSDLDLEVKAPVTKRRGIGPIRTEISPYKIRKKLFIFQIVRCNGICIWQSYLCILPNFGDFGAKTSLFCYLINKNGIVLKNIVPPSVSTSRLYQRCVYTWDIICISGVLIHRGEQCSTAKKWGEGQLTTHEIRYNQRKITSIVNFFIKAWNFA